MRVMVIHTIVCLRLGVSRLFGCGVVAVITTILVGWFTVSLIITRVIWIWCRVATILRVGRRGSIVRSRRVVRFRVWLLWTSFVTLLVVGGSGPLRGVIWGMHLWGWSLGVAIWRVVVRGHLLGDIVRRSLVMELICLVLGDVSVGECLTLELIDLFL